MEDGLDHNPGLTRDFNRLRRVLLRAYFQLQATLTILDPLNLLDSDDDPVPIDHEFPSRRSSGHSYASPRPSGSVIDVIDLTTDGSDVDDDDVHQDQRDRPATPPQQQQQLQQQAPDVPSTSRPSGSNGSNSAGSSISRSDNRLPERIDFIEVQVAQPRPKLTPRRPSQSSSPMRQVQDINIITMICVLLITSSKLIMADNMSFNDTIIVDAHNSRLEMETIGQVIFSTTNAILHFEFDAYGLYQHVYDTLLAFHNTSNLFNQLEHSEFPVLQNMLYQEFHAVTQANLEYKVVLDLISSPEHVRSSRSIGWVGVGLSVLNAGWSTYLTTQSLQTSSKTNHLIHSVGQLQRAIRIQQKQTTDLAQAIFTLQQTTITITDVMSALQMLQSLKLQIKTTTHELHSGIHQHRVPVALFHPIDIAHSWNDFETFLKPFHLMPIFSKRPSQVYEFNADYFHINDSIHILVKIPVKETQQTVYDLQRPRPALLKIKKTLMSYNDPDLIAVAVSKGTISHSVPVGISATELNSCTVLGTTYCCPKQIFPHKKTSCADEFLSGLPYPSDTCLKKFQILDTSKSHVVIRAPNRFDIFTPELDNVRVACPDQKHRIFPISELHEINLPARCTATTKSFKLLSNIDINNIATFHLELRQTLQLADWLQHLPDSSHRFDQSKSSLLNILSKTPDTLQDLFNDPVFETQVNWGMTIALITITAVIVIIIAIFCLCWRRHQQNRQTSDAQQPQIHVSLPRAPEDERTLAARLLNPRF